MNSGFIQDLRFKLQTQIGEFNIIQDRNRFHSLLKRFWGFIQQYPLFIDITNNLAASFPVLEDLAANIQNEPSFGDTVQEQAALSYFIVKRCAGSKDPIEIEIVYAYNPCSNSEALDYFRTSWLYPLYNYIDKQLSDQNVPLTFLVRYKEKCEWFQKEQLFKRWQENRNTGEALLKRHLLEYLHDQGFNILIKEPSFPSGEVDLIAAYSDNQPIILEAKVFSAGTAAGKKCNQRV